LRFFIQKKFIPRSNFNAETTPSKNINLNLEFRRKYQTRNFFN